MSRRVTPYVAASGGVVQASAPAADDGRGGWAERMLFGGRRWVLLLCLAITVALGAQWPKLQLNASFESMIPVRHPYIANFLAHRAQLKGMGNAVTVALASHHGTVFDADYLERLRRLNDDVLALPDVDRPFVKSLWTPNTRWIAVTEDGLDGGTVIPDNYDGTQASLEQVRTNLERSGETGQLVAADYRSSVLQVPLRMGGEAIDYRALSAALEQLRTRYQDEGYTVHITGFAKLAGDMIDGLRAVLLYFGVAVAICAGAVFWYTRCLRSTLLLVGCSLVAVVWQLGLLPLLGIALDPYSMLVPFLVFAIGMSHGAQKMNGIMQDIGRGATRLQAARLTFRRLFLAGLTALLCDAVGFLVLLAIRIEAIQHLAIAASVGVAVLVLTNLVLLPVLLSYTGVAPAAAAHSLRMDQRAAHGKMRLWRLLERCTETRVAWLLAALAGVLAGASVVAGRDLKTGDTDPGAPELRPDARYNRDTAYLAAHYANSSDVFVVLVKTPQYQCAQYDTQLRMDRLEQHLQQVPGVESTVSLAALSRRMLMAMNENHFAWYELLPNQDMLNAVTTRAPRALLDQECSLAPVFVFLKDHKADTQDAVASAAASFAAANRGDGVEFLLAAGNAGIAAATNMVVRDAARDMLLWVYGVVALLCYIAFRNWRAVLVAILPLMLTSLACEALMAMLGIGVKVATLPVIALGVGIGVDYALYVLSVVLAHMRAGQSLAYAFRQALRFTGRVVMLTGVTLGLAVATWVGSPIKFQADMGMLLAFMFVFNMLGALVLLPALARLLLPVPAPGYPSDNGDCV